MRRPLATAGLIFILILLIIQLIFPLNIADYSSYDGNIITVTGRLSRVEYKPKDDGLNKIWYLSKADSGSDHIDTEPDNEVITGTDIIPDNDMIMCYMAEDTPETMLGTIVTVSGNVRSFRPATNPGQFDARRYYAIEHIAFSMTGTRVLWCDRSDISLNWRIKNRLSVIRTRIGALCDLCFDADDSALIRAMLLGDKSAMSPDTRSLYSRNGVAHILAISGLHISMLGMGLVTVLRKCRIPAFASSVTAMILMIMYGMMTGMAASAARAIIMFSLRMTADIVHRTYDMATALIIAAVLILIDQPAYLFYSGFQFSFGAICAVLMILPLLDDIFPKLLSGSLSINIVTLPIYLHNYYYFPMISVILNLYIIPLMSVLLGCAMIALAGCAIFIPLGKILSFPTHLILLLYEWSCRLADLLPINRFVSGKPKTISLVIYIFLVAIILLFKKKQTKLQIILNLSFACVMLTTSLRTGIDIELIDVGQGDGIYITDNCGTDIMIDGGSTDVTDVGTYRIAPFLFSKGVSSLDAVFITHLDADHYNGILEMVNDRGLTMPKIKGLYLTSSTHLAGGEAYTELISAAENAEVPVYTVIAGDRFKCGAITFRCLYPDSSCTGEDPNSESLVLDMNYRDIHMLFTGDLCGVGEEALTDMLRGNNMLKAEAGGASDKITDVYYILKCAHHGSKSSTYDDFLDALGPDLTLISAGRDNSYGHPNPETIERLDARNIPHYCTIDYGALDIHIQGDTVEVIPFINDP
ncbi:MAG: DNA internalization-related competence protein ComEC/Rec2 [Lachnospiraceae bacterium]|nr:DNA internalization-related competence protein ComEC/Rec2 [Lachnospiraceae bacterium]